MTSAPIPSVLPPSPAEEWHEMLKATLLRVPQLPEDLCKKMRKARLTFGERVHCPFLRPFFLSPEDEARVRTVAETIAELGERVASAALDDKHLFAQLHLRPRSEEHTSELQSLAYLVCRLLLEKKNTNRHRQPIRRLMDNAT